MLHIHETSANFHPPEIVCRCRDPQLQVGEICWTYSMSDRLAHHRANVQPTSVTRRSIVCLQTMGLV